MSPRALCGDEENVAEAVAVEAALEVEESLPFVGGCELGDPFGELREKLGAVVAWRSFLIPPCGLMRCHPKPEGGRAEQPRAQRVHFRAWSP